MKKLLVMALVLMSLLICSVVTFADERPGGSASFNVKWTVDPMIYFGIQWGADYALFENGSPILGNPNFSDYVFETKNPGNFYNAWNNPYTEEDVYGAPIFAYVLSNDWWKLQFSKPQLVSDNDQVTNVPVYAKRYFAPWGDNYSETDWFIGNDQIQKDMGAYLMGWITKVVYKNWHTRYGNYQNTFTFVVTQL